MPKINEVQQRYIDMFKTQTEILLELEQINRSLRIYTSQNEGGQTINAIYKNDIVTNNRKSFYENQSYETLKDWFKLFLFVYIFVALITFYVLWSSKYTMPSKVGLGIATIIYPFFLYFMIGQLLYWIQYVYNMLPKNVNLSH